MSAPVTQSFNGNLKKALAGEGLRWRIFDAQGQVLGRLASQIATVVQGKDKPTYTPNREDGNMCIVINAKDVRVTGRKVTDKFYRWHTGYIGHLKERSLKDQMAKDPTEVIRKAVLRMLPRNKLRDDRDRKLRIFAGSEHPFADRPVEPHVMPERQVHEMRPRARNLFYAVRTASISCHHTFPFLNSSNFYNPYESAVVDRVLSSPATTFYQFDTRRGFARGRKQQIKEEDEEEKEDEEDEYEGDDEESSDLGAGVKANAVSQMEAAVDALSRELAKLRTGRASAGMLDHIMVEHYGVKTPLNRMAVVSVLDPKTLSVTPHDPNALKELEKAIISSPLGLNPKSDNQRLITPIPPLSKEHIQALCKVVAKSAEDVKQSIRRARQKALDNIKKGTPKKKDKGKATASSISEDDAKRLEKEIEDLTKRFIKTAEDMCKAKEKEIRGG